MIHTSHHVPGDIIRRVIQDVTSRHGIDDIRRHCPAQLALSEAARLAWRTDYPLLFFPLLAEEKLREVLAPEPSPPPLAAVEDGCLAHW